MDSMRMRVHPVEVELLWEGRRLRVVYVGDEGYEPFEVNLGPKGIEALGKIAAAVLGARDAVRDAGL